MLQKAMVLTLTAAMLVGTPLTASAAPLNSVYSISDGAGNESGNKATPTQTVTNTDTETVTKSSVLETEGYKILGITLDQSYVTAEVDNSEEAVRQQITATVVLDNADTDDQATEELRKQLNKKIRWEVLYYDESKKPKGDYVPSQILGIKSDAANRSVVTLIPHTANKMKSGEEMIVRASIDGRYFYRAVAKRDQNGKIIKDSDGKTQFEKTPDGKIKFEKIELAGSEYDYKADAKVFVKEYSNDLYFDWNLNGTKDANEKDLAPTAYMKHTMDLSKYLARDPKTANDTITWTSTNTQVATVTAAGVVTFKNKKDAACKIVAMSEKGKKATWEISKLDAGMAASKIEIYEKTGNDEVPVADASHQPKKNVVDLDVGKSDLLSKNFTVKMYAKVEAAVATEKVSGKDVPAASNVSKDTGIRKQGEKFVVKKFDIMDGEQYWGWNAAKTDVELKTVKITDKLTWTTNKSAFAVVTSEQDKVTTDSGSITSFDSAKVEARGLGKATITVKASNGKNAKFTADVKASMGGLQILGAKTPSYSGQSVQLTAKKLAFSNSDAEIQNKDAVKWYIAKGGMGTDKYDERKNSDGADSKAILKNVKINNKGVLTVSNKLDDSQKTIYVGLRTVKTKKQLGIGTETTYIYAEPVQVELKQSSISSIVVKDGNTAIATVTADFKTNGNVSFVKNKGITANSIKTNTTLSIPKGKSYTVIATPTDTTVNYEAGTTLTWKNSNAKAIDVAPAADGKSVSITAKAKGSANVTVSGIAVGTKGSAKVISTSFKITVEQPATSLTLKKTQIVMKPKNGKVSVSAAAVLNPKGFRKTNLAWDWRQTAKGDGDLTDAEKEWKPVYKNNNQTKGRVTAASASVQLSSSGVKAGDKFEIRASLPTGYSAICRVEVVTETKKLALVSSYTKATDGTISVSDTDWVTGRRNNAQKKTIGLVDANNTITIKPLIDTDGRNNKAVYYVPGEDKTEDTITYTVNKKGIVNIVKNADGTITVYPVGIGTVKITAKTGLGKSAGVTIEVKATTVTTTNN